MGSGRYVQETYEPFLNGEYLIVWRAFGFGDMWNWYNNETGSPIASNTNDTATPPTRAAGEINDWCCPDGYLIIT